jgi:arsenate reductase (thioredoxin)
MFVCKRNSCRSQIAEGFARSIGSASFEVVSAGLESSNVNPTATEVMREVGIDISGQTSKPLPDFQAENFDVVISLCGCGVNLPVGWTARELFEDWLIDDPDGRPIENFRSARDENKQRVEELLESQKVLTPERTASR